MVWFAFVEVFIFATSDVPASVPSELQSSIPSISFEAGKYSFPLYIVNSVIIEELVPGLMSFTNRVWEKLIEVAIKKTIVSSCFFIIFIFLIIVL